MSIRSTQENEKEIACDRNSNIIDDEDAFFYDELTPLSPLLFEDSNQDPQLSESAQEVDDILGLRSAHQTCQNELKVGSNHGLETVTDKFLQENVANVDTSSLLDSEVSLSRVVSIETASLLQEMGNTNTTSTIMDEGHATAQCVNLTSMDMIGDIVDLLILNSSQSEWSVVDVKCEDCISDLADFSQVSSSSTKARQQIAAAIYHHYTGKPQLKSPSELVKMEAEMVDRPTIDSVCSYVEKASEATDPGFCKRQSSMEAYTTHLSAKRSVTCFGIQAQQISEAVTNLDVIFDWAFGSVGIMKQLAMLKLRKRVQILIRKSSDICLSSSQGVVVASSAVDPKRIAIQLQAKFAEKLKIFMRKNEISNEVSSALPMERGNLTIGAQNQLVRQISTQGIEPACSFDPLELLSLLDDCFNELSFEFNVSIIASDSVCALKSVDIATQKGVSMINSSSYYKSYEEMFSQLTSFTQNMKPRHFGFDGVSSRYLCKFRSEGDKSIKLESSGIKSIQDSNQRLDNECHELHALPSSFSEFKSGGLKIRAVDELNSVQTMIEKGGCSNVNRIKRTEFSNSNFASDLTNERFFPLNESDKLVSSKSEMVKTEPGVEQCSEEKFIESFVNSEVSGDKIFSDNDTSVNPEPTSCSLNSLIATSRCNNVKNEYTAVKAVSIKDTLDFNVADFVSTSKCQNMQILSEEIDLVNLAHNGRTNSVKNEVGYCNLKGSPSPLDCSSITPPKRGVIMDSEICPRRKQKWFSAQAETKAPYLENISPNCQQTSYLALQEENESNITSDDGADSEGYAEDLAASPIKSFELKFVNQSIKVEYEIELAASFYPGSQLEKFSPYFETASDSPINIPVPDRGILNANYALIDSRIRNRTDLPKNESFNLVMKISRTAQLRDTKCYMLNWLPLIKFKAANFALYGEIRLRGGYFDFKMNQTVTIDSSEDVVVKYSESEPMERVERKTIESAKTTSSLVIETTPRVVQVRPNNLLIKTALINSARQKIFDQAIKLCSAPPNIANVYQAESRTEVGALEAYFDETQFGSLGPIYETKEVCNYPTDGNEAVGNDCSCNESNQIVGQSQFIGDICTPTQNSGNQDVQSQSLFGHRVETFELQPTDFVEFDDCGTNLSERIASLLYEDETVSDFWNRKCLPKLDQDFTEKRRQLMKAPMQSLDLYDSQVPQTTTKEVHRLVSPADEGYSGTPKLSKISSGSVEHLMSSCVLVSGRSSAVLKRKANDSPDCGYETPKIAKMTPPSNKETSAGEPFVKVTVTEASGRNCSGPKHLGAPMGAVANTPVCTGSMNTGLPPIANNSNQVMLTTPVGGRSFFYPSPLGYPLSSAASQCTCCNSLSSAPGINQVPIYAPFHYMGVTHHPPDQPYDVPFVELSESGSLRKRRHGMQKSDCPSYRLGEE
ncbi:uncharacterized protein LOC142358752 isoform X2 [Convolutriloba macropyga]|uniref:uncharacterized protein LOC142358752 isoform X2 n=1 Tax=Convolutriloba macropyga TaxID=536237 RepID=UPI003F52227B